MKNIFDILNSVSGIKNDLSNEEKFKSIYNPFMINRFLSMSPDTVFFANWVNQHSNIPDKYQYLIYLYGIEKKKRFFKYEKAEKQTEDIQAIKDYYKINTNKAMEFERLLSNEQIKQLKKKMEIGGTK